MIDIEKLRKRLQWTQDELADFLAYTGRNKRSQVSNIESGKTKPGPAVVKLVRLLWLYGWNASKLWDRRKAKRIKPILDEDDDGKPE